MIAGKMICENCGKDVTGGLWGFVFGIRPGLNQKQISQLAEFKKEFGKEQMVWCWNCVAKTFGAKSLTEKKAEEDFIKENPDTQKENDNGDNE